jgi:predicted transcriptional regulator
MAQPKNPPLSVRISPELLARLDVAAKDHGVSRNALVILAVEAWCGRATRATQALTAAAAAKKAGQIAMAATIPFAVPFAGTFRRPVRPKGAK